MSCYITPTVENLIVLGVWTHTRGLFSVENNCRDGWFATNSVQATLKAIYQLIETFSSPSALPATADTYGVHNDPERAAGLSALPRACSGKLKGAQNRRSRPTRACAPRDRGLRHAAATRKRAGKVCELIRAGAVSSTRTASITGTKPLAGPTRESALGRVASVSRGGLG